MGPPKAVVVFAGARDRYQVPWALNEAGLLEALVTDAYWPADRNWLTRTVGVVSARGGAPPRWARTRYCSGLSSDRVRISGGALAALLAMRAVPHQALQIHKDRCLGGLARATALRREAALLAYSYYAYAAFQASEPRPRLRFLFQVHPHPRSVRAILAEELERVPAARASLMAEPDLGLPENRFQELADEPHLANGWVVASSYTRRSLIENGLPAGQIHVVPYGVDSAVRDRYRRPPTDAGPLRAIFVGSLIQRKGLTYLLDAVRALKTRHLRLTLCGRGFVDDALLRQYADVDPDVRLNLPSSDLFRRIQESDVFVFPSLVEGFGHVILEAMACGLPVITTSHTCAPDVMQEGVHGFIVPIRDSDAIAERLAWGLDHRADLAAMGEAAAAQAGLFTWPRFRAGIREAYRSMVAAVDTRA